MLSRFSTTISIFAKSGPRRLYLCHLTASRALTTNSLPHTVRVSASERQSGSLTDQNLELANRAIHADGLVVLDDVIPHHKLDFLNEKMVADARYLQSLGDKSPYNYNKGNIQQDPPLTKTYFDPETFLNPIAAQITSSVLGSKPRLSFISANAALPSFPPTRQPVHSDADFAHPSSPFALVINIPLITMTPENGSTELWLGTHSISSKDCQEGDHGERASGRVKADLLEERREVRAPCQPVVKKGSVVVRDLRLWHAGMPNLGAEGEVRVMLALIHFAGWYRNTMEVSFSEDVRGILGTKGMDLDVHSKFVPEKTLLDTYLEGKFGNAYDFDQRDKLEVQF